MKKVNEIFYSIQGEGAWAGTPAIFIRFSGCNLKCPFCDTDFKSYEEMTDEQIMSELKKYPSKMVILTGGEPTLQVNNDFVIKLKSKGYYVAMETNGTNIPAPSIDWVTVSPKEDYVKGGKLKVQRANEVKVVFDLTHNDPSKYLGIISSNYYLQPCDVGNKKKNDEIMKATVEYCKKNPIWHISLQTQKILKVR